MSSLELASPNTSRKSLAFVGVFAVSFVYVAWSSLARPGSLGEPSWTPLLFAMLSASLPVLSIKFSRVVTLAFVVRALGALSVVAALGVWTFSERKVLLIFVLYVGLSYSWLLLYRRRASIDFSQMLTSRLATRYETFFTPLLIVQGVHAGFAFVWVYGFVPSSAIVLIADVFFLAVVLLVDATCLDCVSAAWCTQVVTTESTVDDQIMLRHALFVRIFKSPSLLGSLTRYTFVEFISYLKRMFLSKTLSVHPSREVLILHALDGDDSRYSESSVVKSVEQESLVLLDLLASVVGISTALLSGTGGGWLFAMGYAVLGTSAFRLGSSWIRSGIYALDYAFSIQPRRLEETEDIIHSHFSRVREVATTYDRVDLDDEADEFDSDDDQEEEPVDEEEETQQQNVA